MSPDCSSTFQVKALRLGAQPLLPCQCPAALEHHLAEAGFAQSGLALLGPHLPKQDTALGCEWGWDTGHPGDAVWNSTGTLAFWVRGPTPLSAAQRSLPLMHVTIAPGFLLSHASRSLRLVVGRDT